MKETIFQIIQTEITENNQYHLFRTPLVGYASFDDPLYKDIKNLAGAQHLYPQDFLPQGQTVISFFIPFAKMVVDANRKSETVAREWAFAYTECNRLINQISDKLVQFFLDQGIEAAAIKATNVFDKDLIKATFSHRSAAYIAGLGEFGRNRLLITEKGCAGRFGTVLTAAQLNPTPRSNTIYCIYHKGGKCIHCIRNCPTGALQDQNINRPVCLTHCLDTLQLYPDIEGDSCGKCSLGPCAVFET